MFSTRFVRSRPDPALLALALVLATSSPAPLRAATGFAAPAPNLIYQLEKQNRGRPWLRITADSTRWTARVHRFDETGPRGIDGRKDEPPVPNQLAWSSISRIDEVVTAEKRGRFLGFLAGGAAGLVLGNMIGASDGSGWSEGMIGLLIAGNAGAWIGGRWGDNMVREEPWYVATPARPAPRVEPAAEIAAADSAQPASIAGRPEERTAPSASFVSESPRVLKACARIGRGDLIRVRGDFGLFQGFAGVAGPQGLDRLRADPRHRPANVTVPAGLVAWNRIDYVDVRGNSAGKGALTAGLGTGAAGGLLTAAVVAGLGGTTNEAVGGFFAGGAIIGGIGALIGVAIGAAVPAWHNVYDGP